MQSDGLCIRCCAYAAPPDRPTGRPAERLLRVAPDLDHLQPACAPCSPPRESKPVVVPSALPGAASLGRKNLPDCRRDSVPLLLAVADTVRSLHRVVAAAPPPAAVAAVCRCLPNSCFCLEPNHSTLRSLYPPGLTTPHSDFCTLPASCTSFCCASKACPRSCHSGWRRRCERPSRCPSPLHLARFGSPPLPTTGTASSGAPQRCWKQ